MKKLFKSLRTASRNRAKDDTDLQRPIQNLTSEDLAFASELRTFASNQEPNENRNGLRAVPLPTMERPKDQKDYDIDIVAVHGLGGDYYNTWTSGKDSDLSGQIYWLSHLLPYDLPGARIFSFGYDSGFAFSRSVAGIKEYAKQLLLDLLSCTESNRRRPIVFLCHSLGGIVVKQAIVLAHENHQYSEILRNIRAIMFMGTPHRGSDIAAAARPLSRLINFALSLSGTSAVTGLMRTDLFKLLSHESTQLGDINESFVHRLENIVIMSCYETEIPRGLQHLVVKKSSAILGIQNEQQIPVSADHMTMCRFASRSESKYKNVSGALLRFAQVMIELKDNSAIGMGGAQSPNKSLSESELKYVGRFAEDFSRALSDRVKGTCAWSIRSVPYSEWLHDEQSTILWITGDAGCGKTTLTSFVIETLSQELDSTTIKETATSLVCYLFCSRNVQEPTDACSILRGLIVQLLVSSKDVVKRVRAAFSTAKQCFDQSYQSLWKVFCYAAEVVRYDVLYLVIDGLDECEVKSKEMFLRSASQMLDLYNHSNGLPGKQVKFLVTGQPDTIRYWTAIANRSRHYHLSMESRPQAMVTDVMNYINSKVDELVAMRICTISSADALRQSLHQLAGNSFLWASVVLEQSRISLELTPNNLPQLVSSIPTDLKEAYMRYLPKVPDQGTAVLQKYIQLLVACRRPLSLEEIATCMVSGHSHSIDDIKTTRNTMIESSLQRAFGPLVRISQGQIFFAHTTVRDYLVDIGAEKSHPLHDTHGVNMCGAHLTLAIACMRYLSLNDFSHNLFTIQDSKVDNSLSSTESNAMDQHSVDDIGGTLELFGIDDVAFLKDEDSMREISCEQIKAQFEFYDYAAVNWTYHYACSEAVATEEVVRQAIELSTPHSTHFENWYKYVVARSRTSMPELSELDSVTVAALFDHSTNLRFLLSDVSDRHTQDYTAAIFWAASKGNAEVVRTLIEHDVDPNKTHNGQTPLAIAIQAGHLRVCTTLLGYSGTDPNSTGMRGTGPLSLAAAHNHREILDLLLLQKGIEINRENHLGRTALIEASSNGSLECLRILLHDGRSSVNHQDRKGQNALIHAIRNGSYSICSLLMKSPSFQGDLTDVRGRNAMSHAAEGGDLGIVQLLWRRKISISDQDLDGRNAISWAANSASAIKTNHDGHCALRFLVENSQHSVDLLDNNGWTPLAWAMGPPGYLEAVKILIGYGCVDVNQCDGTRGRPVLSWAASEGFLDITRFLLKTSGIRKNQIDHDGRTPISYAAGSGHIDIVNLLAEDAEVVLDMQDSAGRAALDWAVLGRHDAVAEKLQHYLQIRL